MAKKKAGAGKPGKKKPPSKEQVRKALRSIADGFPPLGGDKKRRK